MAEVFIYKDTEAVASAAADVIADKIMACLALNPECHTVLPGGSTPARCLEILSGHDLPWHRLHWYPGDERCVEPDHADRNDVMIRQKLKPSSGDDIHLHSIPAELGLEQAVPAYRKIVDALVEKQGGFDLAILGMGEDGHTASLFPGQTTLDHTASVVAVTDSPKPPPERVSLGVPVLRASSFRMVIATGAGKRDIIESAVFGSDLPVSRFQAETWMLDEDICTDLELFEKYKVTN